MAGWELLNPFLRLLGLIIVAFGTVSPLIAVERVVKKSFSVTPGATLKLNTYRGSIIVDESEDAEIHADVRIELATDDEAVADRLMKGLQLDLSSAENVVTILARNPSESRVRFIWTEQRLDLGFRLRVPKACQLNLTTIDGNITVGSASGNVVLRARAGALSCRQIDGDVDASVEVGDIVVSRCTDAVDLRVTRGNIRAGTIFGAAKLHNASGDIEIQSARGGVIATTAAGDITAGFPRQLSGSTNIKADGGSVYARFDPATRCDVHASALWGQVKTNLPFSAQPGGNSKRLFVGQLNAGGPSITLRASGGNVEMEAFTQFVE